ncbi:type II secretion system protein [Sporosarcina sp. PTS2304]|uniref:type II secretion system protein n=1 Tax=Sporosarcina sp. PTS2304 TaxID=2283194 RepID=UPI000E0DB0F9|nr:type II secretion system protein [Sporosarcina sp. PTS2304]AXH99325.1 type II secretion system protein [Sporosarcina sp. PTS2304]
MNNIRNQRGLTLVELLATLALIGVITTFAFSILMNGIRASNNIQIETSLRNEADVIMSSFIRTVYTMKESEISELRFPAKNTENYYIQTNTGEKTGFIKNEVWIANKKQLLFDPDISVLPSEISQPEPGQYEIVLRLKMAGDRPKEMTFVNVVRTIDDLKTKKGDDDE